MHSDKSVVQSVCCGRSQQVESRYSCIGLWGFPGGATQCSSNGFCVGDDSRTPHVSKHLTRGGAEEKRTRYAARLGGSSRIIRAAGRIIEPRGRRYSVRHTMILLDRGEAPSLSTLQWVGGSLGEV